MTTASQDKITVPGDDRLTKLNVSTKTPFWTKIPIIKELRVAVGWQKGMLITGLAITAFFLLVALFAPLIAPYGHAQIKAADGGTVTFAGYKGSYGYLVIITHDENIALQAHRVIAIEDGRITRDERIREVLE